MLPSADPHDDAAFRAAGWWSDETLSERVAELAVNHADGLAYGSDDSRMTWAEYDRLADRLAARLRAVGVARGDRVLVWLPDGGVVHAAYVACERAGCVVVGIGWRAGERELRSLSALTAAAYMMVASVTPLGSGFDIGARLGIAADRTIVVDELVYDDLVATSPAVHTESPKVRQEGAAGSHSAPIGASELWFVNSTSGTTGLPKCVMQTQNRWRYFHHKATAFGALTTDDVFMSVLPAPFGFGLWTAHVTPALLGVPCHVQARFDPAAAARTIASERVTVLCATSSQFVMVLDAADALDITSLRVLFTGGEAISPSRAREFEARTGCTVLNFYGSNETGMLSGTMIGDPLEMRVTTGGRIVDEMQVRLYDDAGRRIAGDRGEGRPACRGPALSLGYLDDDAANAELCIDDGWMLMGDRVRIDADGWLTVIGRTADFIIRGGKNLSAAAIEDDVASHPAVALAAAVAVPDDRLGERVGVFVELRSGLHDLTIEDLQAHLAARGVGREWWPEHLCVLDALPRSSGGKVAKSTLRSQALSRFETPGRAQS